MNTRKIFMGCLFVFLACFSVEVWAGELVWGPKKYVRSTGKPVSVMDSFTIEKPKGKFWLQVSNGGSVRKPGEKPFREPVNQASSAYIKLNGVQVVGPDDFNQNIYGFTKDITLQANNTIEVEVRGNPGSYITVEIRKAELNVGVDNTKGDLSGENMKDQIVLWWSYEENATEYVVYKAYSIDGPWIKWRQFGNTPPYNIVDGTSEAETKDLCYKMEAVDSNGKVIRQYEPICVPKWQEEESSLPLSQRKTPDRSISIAKGKKSGNLSLSGRGKPSLPFVQLASLSMPIGIQLVSATSPQSSDQSSPPYNSMCLSNDEFIDTSTMNYDDIKKFLKDNKSFLKEDEVKDVDGSFFDPAEFIDFAAQTYGINPQVVLATLQKEQRAIKAQARLESWRLKHIMGYGKPSTITDQILDATKQMRLDFDKLSKGQTTISGWGVGVKKPTGHFDDNHPEKNNPELDKDGNQIYVTPTSKVVALLFSYTPWVGEGWGGIGEDGKAAGGNALFCKVWDKWGFGVKCDSIAITISGTDTPVDGACYTASGGTEPYTWTITMGSIDTNGCVTVTGQCGTATITATDANGCSGTKEVNMPIKELAITGPETITKNSNAQYTASDCPSNVEWTVSGTGVSINSSGLLTTDGTACGTITVTANCHNCNLSVSKNVRVTCDSALILSGSDTITKNSTSQYTATGCCETVSWSVSGTGATISSTGLLTAGSTACGSLLVTATCAGCGTSVTQYVRVTDAGRWILVESCDCNCQDRCVDGPPCCYTLEGCGAVIGEYYYINYWTCLNCDGSSCIYCIDEPCQPYPECPVECPKSEPDLYGDPSLCKPSELNFLRGIATRKYKWVCP